MQTPITRRETLRGLLFAGMGAWLAGGLSPRLRGAEAILASATNAVSLPPPSGSWGKAKSVIQLWMGGGPPHLDTFDPKPETGNDYSGPLKAIDTHVPGIRIGESLPLLALQADKYAIIRGMTHGNNAHETAAYMVQTGRKAGEREVYPCAGAVVSLFRGYEAGYKGLVPPYIVLTDPQGRFPECGFLGLRYKPFATGGDPAQQRFIVEGIVAPGMDDKQQISRRDFLRKLDLLPKVIPNNPTLQLLTRSQDQAYDMILGDGAKVFDLATESNELRDRYGRTKFGQSCLMARRLVEKGVPYITINDGGWDTHKDNFTAMRRKLPDLDKGFATLLQDLAERGLLESTVVWWGGEFGRTPKVRWDPPWNGGRDHWGKAFSHVVAGGGFKGGHVVGVTDAKGEEVVSRPVYPCDLIGSIYALMGIDGSARLPHSHEGEAHVLPMPSDNIPSTGILREIM